MTVKEAFNVTGLPTTRGLEQFKHIIADRDDVGIARLNAAGAVILGKTNVPPSLGDWQSANPVYGRTNNPHDLGRSPGGSSGGSAAALAAGMVPLEFGSDIGGSIRVPSVFCGAYGHKPSFDLVPGRDHIPPGAEGAGADLGVVGPMARSAEDLALGLEVLAGPAYGDETGYKLDLPAMRHAKLSDYRVLVIDENPRAGLDDEIRAGDHLLAGRMSAAGAKVSYGSALIPDLEAAHRTYVTLLNTIMTRGAPGAREPISAHQWLAAVDERARVRRQWADLFKAFDVVVAPAFGTVAFPHVTETDWSKRTLEVNGEATPYGDQLTWPGMATFPGLPATAVPVTRSKAGLPVGAQIIGPYLEDRMTIAVAGLVAGLS
jgi:amidase